VQALGAVGRCAPAGWPTWAFDADQRYVVYDGVSVHSTNGDGASVDRIEGNVPRSPIPSRRIVKAVLSGLDKGPKHEGTL